MKFGPVPVSEALGVVLAHTFRGDGLTIKKGTALSAEDIEALKKCGVGEIVGARLDRDDVPENEAAARIAARLCGANVQASDARTGRCNLTADFNGVVQINTSEINAVNQINETVTVATLANFEAVKAGQIIATVKIIPYAVAPLVMEHVERVLVERAVAVRPYQSKKFAILSTIAAGLKESVKTSTEDLTRRRVSAVGGSVISAEECPHTTKDVANAIREAVAAGTDILLIIGASATVDRGDVAPAAVLAAGGFIDHFGMPVDPGNLLVIGEVGGTTVLVLPGCARSPKLNGVDWVLRRLAAELPIGHIEIMGMGVGGLLVDTPARPLPRDSAVKKESADPSVSVAAVVLAAGQSRRMEGQNKLLMEIDGKPLVRRTVETVLASRAKQVVVVTGHQENEVKDALKGLDVTVVHNPKFADGLSTSLQTGLDALPVDAAAALVCLGDMPAVSSSHIDKLIESFDPESGRAIGVPAHNGKRGNPVLWARRFFDEMRGIEGDVGARHLIGANESLVYEEEFSDTAVLTDLDTPQQWSEYLGTPS